MNGRHEIASFDGAGCHKEKGAGARVEVLTSQGRFQSLLALHLGRASKTEAEQIGLLSAIATIVGIFSDPATNRIEKFFDALILS